MDEELNYQMLLQQATECPMPEKTNTIRTLAFVHMIKDDSWELIYFDSMRDFFFYWEMLELYAFQPKEKPTHLFLTKKFSFIYNPEILLMDLSKQREEECGVRLRKWEYNSFKTNFQRWVSDNNIDNYITADTSRKVRIPWEEYHK